MLYALMLYALCFMPYALCPYALCPYALCPYSPYFPYSLYKPYTPYIPYIPSPPDLLLGLYRNHQFGNAILPGNVHDFDHEAVGNALVGIDDQTAIQTFLHRIFQQSRQIF